MGLYSALLSRLQQLQAAVTTRYQFDLDPLLARVLPYLLRKPKTLGYLRALVAPAAELYELLLQFTLYARRELSYNGQTMLMEKALNDRFDAAFRRIRIINSDASVDPFYINYERELQPAKYVYRQEEGKAPRYLHRYVESINGTGFTVRVPVSLQGQEVALHTRIRQLKIALVNYRIIYF